MGKVSSPLERFISGSYEKNLYDPNRVIPRIGFVPEGDQVPYLSFGEGFFNKGAKSTVLCNSSSPPVAATNVVKGQWTAEEDGLLVKLVKQYGVRKWSQIAKKLVGRIGKQCRERWHNHLRPDIKKDTWSEEEERLLVEAHEKVGNRWAEIAKRIPGRSENSIKNHWNTTKRRQNSKRTKSKRKSGQGPTRSHPSILQEYIRSKTLAAENESVSAYDDSSSLSVANNYTNAMQLPAVCDLIEKPCFLDHGSFDHLLGFGNNDGTFMGLMDEINPNYDLINLSYLLEGAGPNYMADEHSSSSNFKKDMDLIEMISSSSQSASCSQRSTVAEDSLDCPYI